MYEGKAIDEFYKQEKLKVYFYESKTKDKIGMISMRKGKILFFNYYQAYESMEVDYKKQIYVYKTNLSKGLDAKDTYSLENIDRVVFNDTYTINRKGGNTRL